MELARQLGDLRRAVERELVLVGRRFVMARSTMEPADLDVALMNPADRISLVLSFVRIMNISVPSLAKEIVSGGLYYGLATTSAELDASLRAMIDPRPGHRELAESIADDRLVPVTDHVFRSERGEASTWIVVSDAGKALAIDYGYRLPHMWPGYPYPRHRRPLLHGLEPLRERFGIDRIDVVLLTHFHDDHVNAVPMLQRLHIAETSVTDLTPLRHVSLTRLVFTPGRITEGLDTARQMTSLRQIGTRFDDNEKNLTSPAMFWDLLEKGEIE